MHIRVVLLEPFLAFVGRAAEFAILMASHLSVMMPEGMEEGNMMR